jgi:hypothetical protein
MSVMMDHWAGGFQAKSSICFIERFNGSQSNLFAGTITGRNFKSRALHCCLLQLQTKSIQNPGHIACLLRIWMQPQKLLQFSHH